MNRNAYLQVGKPGRPKKFKTFTNIERLKKVTKKIRDMTKSAKARVKLFHTERELERARNESLRDLYAGFAVSGIALSYWEKDRLERILKKVASAAYRIADLMMAERKKRGKK